jgi:PAS domain S-box-containing protein
VSEPVGDRERVEHGDALARALRAEDELERFFALSLDLLCIATLDGLFTRVNPAFERVLGYASEELLQQPFLDFVHPDDRTATVAQLESVARGVGTVSFENRYRRRDGGYRWLQWTSMPDAEHGVVYAVARDVTDAKAAESGLRTLLAGQAALRRVATQVACERGHSEVFELVTEEIGSLLGARSASIVRFEAARRGVVMGGWTEPGAVRIPTGTVIELERGIAAGDVFHTGEAVRIERFDGAEGTLVQRIVEMGIRSALGAPIRVGGELWGAVVASSDGDEPWPEGAEHRLEDFAELVAQALANADAREQLAASRGRLVEAGDAERRRLERNLHDGAQQRLVTPRGHAAPRAGAAGDRSGGRASAARHGRRGTLARTRRAARARERPPPGRPLRARAEAGAGSAGGPRSDRRRARRGTGRAVPGARGGRRVLPRLGGADEHGQVRRRLPGHRRRLSNGRRRGRRGRGRRRRRGGPQRWLRAPRAGRPDRGARRRPRHREPERRRDEDQGRDPVRPLVASRQSTTPAR